MAVGVHSYADLRASLRPFIMRMILLSLGHTEFVVGKVLSNFGLPIFRILLLCSILRTQFILI